MAEIRDARESDAEAVGTLLSSLGYPETQPFIHARLAHLLSLPDERVLVAVEHSTVVGVLSLHFIPQLGLAGDFCRISYFCVDEAARGEGIGARLEARATELARARRCDRIEVHCHASRLQALRFYGRQGYAESPQYLIKSLAVE
ncbi:MAG TPA: GNAT family N-acetyltransferase [Nitrospira sp.]|nr:GNAT family N-acetyltransferase [Nitrospira sp.]